MKKFLLKYWRLIIYILLILCVWFFFYADLKLSNFEVKGIRIFERYGNGLFTNILSALISFTLIDSLLNYYDNQKSKIYRTIAYKQLLKSFWKLGEIYTYMIKASLDKLPPQLTKDIPTTLRANFALNIERLEFIKEAPVIPNQLWYQRAYGVVSSALEDIHKTTDAYLPYIDTSLIDNMLELEGNTLIVSVINAPIMIETNEYGYTQFPIYIGNGQHLRKGLDLLATIFETLRKESDLKMYYGLTIGFWDPQYGAVLSSARVENLHAPGCFEGIQVLEDEAH